jgi:5,10-methylenetetrahydrofolate reductase
VRFSEEAAADFIARYYSDETSYALKPAMNDGAFRSICDRAMLLKLAAQQSRRDLAVVVLVHYPSEETKDAAKLAWVKDLKALGYQRIVFLRGGNRMQANGLPILASPQAPAAFAGK